MGAYLRERGVKVAVFPESFDASLCIVDVIKARNKSAAVDVHQGMEGTYRTKPYPLGRSATWRVKVRALCTLPNSRVMLSSCSSGKLGGRPLTYTFGVRSTLGAGSVTPAFLSRLSNDDAEAKVDVVERDDAREGRVARVDDAESQIRYEHDEIESRTSHLTGCLLSRHRLNEGRFLQRRFGLHEEFEVHRCTLVTGVRGSWRTTWCCERSTCCVSGELEVGIDGLERSGVWGGETSMGVRCLAGCSRYRNNRLHRRAHLGGD